ncbi:MAG TPA: CopG family transcriptional regulator [Thermoanaerobaculia bacterium]|nr:CopG family transcriptional regulator [Thermoanaerobaculia bacterium]
MADMKPQPAPRAVKTSLSLPPDALSTLRELAATRNTTLAEVVRRAVRVDKFVAEALADGGKVYIEKDGKTTELIFF